MNSMICKSCKKELPATKDFFYMKSIYPLAFEIVCKKCKTKARKTRYLIDRQDKDFMENQRSNSLERYRKNKDKPKRKTKHQHALKKAEWTKNNKEKTKETTAKYRLKNKENIAARRATHRAGKATFDIFSPQLSWAEETRRDPKNEKKLQVVCALCQNWFTPTIWQVEARIGAINGRQRGSRLFYCSENCKRACPVFYRHKYRKGENPRRVRPGQKEWREHVIACAEYSCERCGKVLDEKDLSAHHIKPVAQYPSVSMDIDNGMALCKDCHKTVHSEIGCRPVDLRCGT